MTDDAFGGHDKLSLRQLPAGLAAFIHKARESERPLAIVTMGSAPPQHASAVFMAALAACEKLGVSAVLLCSMKALPQGWAPSAHTHHEAYAPFAALLHHAQVFLYNGGIGGFSQASRAGCPQLIVPVAFDQPHNAETAVRLGIGMRVDWQGGACAEQEMTAAISRLLTSPAVRQRCDEVRVLSETDGESGCQRAARHVLDLAARIAARRCLDAAPAGAMTDEGGLSRA